MATPYSSVRKGPNALVRTFGPGGVETVAPGRPADPNARWEYVAPGDYAKYKAATTAKPSAVAAALNPYAGQVSKNTGGATFSDANSTGGYGAGQPGGGLKSNPFLTDPGYLSALAAEQSGTQQADNALRAAQEQAITQFGDPSLAQAAGLNINPLTATAAQANTAAGTSTVAGLQRTRDDNQQNILDSLAAHGMLDSGQTMYATGRNQQAYGQDLYNATQTALGGLNTAAATDVSTKQGLHSDVTKALTGAYDTMVANPALWGAADTGGPKAAANTAATTPAAAPAPRQAAAPQAPTPGWIRSGYGEVPAGAPVATALARPPVRPTAQVSRNVRAG